VTTSTGGQAATRGLECTHVHPDRGLTAAVPSSIADQYSSGRLGASILDALRAAGHDPDDLDLSALAPFEEFHTLGRVASTALAEAAAITSTDLVLDVGCGIGGPARFLAAKFGCKVTGIDLTPEFIDVARDLNARVGLGDTIDVRVADALDLPFPDARFDVVWTQHVSMNIADKPGLYAELGRVLRPEGRLAFFDIVAGEHGPPHFPVPWADEPDRSFLAKPEAIRETLESSEWTITHWEDLTNEALQWFTTRAEAPPSPSPLGLHLVMPNMRTKVGNLHRNLAEDRVLLLRCVARRQA
jgi:SAM-dependent methyltransferase